MTIKQSQNKINQARDILTSARRDIDSIRRNMSGFDRDYAKLAARIDSLSVRAELLLNTEK